MRQVPARRCVSSCLPLLAPLALSMLAGAAQADQAVPQQPGAAKDALLSAFPGVRASELNGRTFAFYGGGMTIAPTSDGAALSFVDTWSSAFGAGRAELVFDRFNPLSDGTRTVYAFRQMMDGLPVEYGLARVLVRDAAGDAPAQVVYAAAKLVQRPEGGFQPDTLDAQAALERVQTSQIFRTQFNLSSWTQPELVVFAGLDEFEQAITPVRAWKFTGESADRLTRRTFFVDAASGDVVHVRNEILHVNITGQVQGWVSPGNRADSAANPPVLVNMPEALVEVVSGTTVLASAKSDQNGNFTIPWSGTTAVTLRVRPLPFATNQWYANPTPITSQQQRVDNSAGAEFEVTVSATPGTPASIVLNPSASRTEVTTAITNVLYYHTLTRNYFASQAPSFAATMDTVSGVGGPQILPANVMVAGSCNAFYNGVSTNYYPNDGTCNNTAFASVISHEYGHHIVNRLGLAQGAFGEGYSDTISILMYDDIIIGRDFQTNGGIVRNPQSSNIQYPCASTAIHTCGMILGDVVWDMRNNLTTTLGSGPALTYMRQLHADWSLITVGGINLDSAHPQTAIEYLTVDDVDSTYCNGTPNYNAIRSAFLGKSIPVPGIEARLSVSPVGAIPSSVNVGQNLVIDVDVVNGTGTLTPGSARVRYRHAATNQFFTATMSPLGGNRFRASIPAGNCGQAIDFSFVFGSNLGDVTLPNACTGGTFYTAQIVSPTITVNSQDFESSNGGYTVGPDTATLGNWAWGDPIGTAAQPSTGFNSTNCWFTGQGTTGGGLGEADVDGGATILTSPTINLAGQSQLGVSYQRWYDNGAGAGPYADVFRVQVSTNNGTTWTDAEVIGPGSASDPQVNGGWFAGGFSFAGLGVTPTSQTRIRFIAEDAGTGSLIEAAIDDVRIFRTVCPCQDVDFNNDGIEQDPTDIEDFLSVYSGGACSTGNCDSVDFNQDGIDQDPTDIESFLSVYSGGSCL